MVSRKLFPIDISSLRFGGAPIKLKSSMTIVGFDYDSKLIWADMVQKQAKKARARLAALFRLKLFLDGENLKTMYTSFVRSVCEFGSIGYMAATDSHLVKLDRIQNRAQRVCEFEVESLVSRREAVVVSMILKMLGGDARGALNDFTPDIVQVDQPMRGRKCKKLASASGLQLQKTIKKSSLVSFRRCALGQAHMIWSKLPQELVIEGDMAGWKKIKQRCKMHLTGKIVKRKQKFEEGDFKLLPDNYSCKLNNELGSMVA